MKTIRVLLLIAAVFAMLQPAAAQSDIMIPADIKNRIIKLDFFSPLTGNLTLGYEQALTNHITLKGHMGLIGVSFVDFDHTKGLFLKAGPKLYFNPDYVLEGMKRFNDFQGAYFNPEIIYSGFSFDYDSYNAATGINSEQRATNNSIAVMLNLGKQWVLSGIISLDLHAGIGYGTSFITYEDSQPPSVSGQDSYVTYKFSHAESPEIPLVFSAGFDIGVLLK